MLTPNPQGSLDQATVILEALQVIRDLQISIKKSDDRMQKVEEVTQNFSETQHKIYVKMDDITLMLQQWNSLSELSSAEKAPRTMGLPSPPPSFTIPDYTKFHTHTPFPTSTPDTTTASSFQSFAFTTPYPQNPTSGVVYTINPTSNNTHTTASPIPNQHTHKATTFTTETHRIAPETFNLAIARLKLDFPSYFRDDPFNWLRQYEKYFSLASIPMEN
jgi:hypothetical protein